MDYFLFMQLNQIICGNALTELKKLPNESMDCVITDPPYNINLGKNYYFNKKRKNYNEYVDKLPLHSKWIPEIYRVLKEKTHFYCFSGYTEITKLIQESIKIGFEIKGILVWDKKWTGWIAGAYGYKYKPKSELCCFFSKGKRKINNPETPDILQIKRIRGIEHPCPKPIELLEIFIQNSTNENDLILDCFIGSGSTAIAARNLKRNYLGIEINPKYVEMAERRINATPKPLL